MASSGYNSVSHTSRIIFLYTAHPLPLINSNFLVEGNVLKELVIQQNESFLFVNINANMERRQTNMDSLITTIIPSTSRIHKSIHSILDVIFVESVVILEVYFIMLMLTRKKHPISLEQLQLLFIYTIGLTTLKYCGTNMPLMDMGIVHH